MAGLLVRLFLLIMKKWVCIIWFTLFNFIPQQKTTQWTLKRFLKTTASG